MKWSALSLVIGILLLVIGTYLARQGHSDIGSEDAKSATLMGFIACVGMGYVLALSTAFWAFSSTFAWLTAEHTAVDDWK